MTTLKLDDRYQAQVETEEKKWRTIGRPLHETVDDARKAIKEYGQDFNITHGGICFLYIPADKQKHTFRIVKCERTVIEEITK